MSRLRDRAPAGRILTAVGGALALAAVVAAQPPPSAEVEALLSLPHGLARLAPAERVWLAAMQRDPPPYVAAVQAIFPSARVVAVLDVEAAARWARAAQLLASLASDDALDLLARWTIALDEAAARAATEARAELVTRRALALDALAPVAHPDVVEHVLARLPTLDARGRAEALGYLGRATRGDAAVAAGLRGLRETGPDADWKRDPALERTIILIDGGVPPHPVPGEPAAVVDRLLGLPLGRVEPTAVDAELVARVARDPEPYRVALTAAVGDDAVAQLASEADLTHASSSAWLLGQIGDTRARAELEGLFARVDRTLPDPPQAANRGRLLRLRDAVLDALAGRCPASVAGMVVDRLGAMSPPERRQPTSWLAASCRGERDVARRVRALVDDPKSALHRDPQLERTLHAWGER